MRAAVFLFLLMLIFGNMQEAEKEVKLNQEFKLRLNEQSVLRSEELRIKFLAVTEDSRCPEGADCIWEGNGKVRIAVKKSGGEFKTFELNTTLEPKSTKFEDCEIQIVNLEPKPKSDVETKKENYTVTLIINKNPSPNSQNPMLIDFN